ncbi:hypothetical protein [Nocardia jiangxiensis]|uniref:hypothetical protein n=1 Tax=Nocardia jiangxiensis TaxID=282685 RepID=UPI0012F6708F|nr:hypothetical protein [Nocardia jiangxiensis]
MNNISRATTLATAVAATAVAVATVAAGPASAEAPAAPAAPAGPAAPVDPGAEYLKAFDTLAGAYGNDSNSGRTAGAVIGSVVGCGVGAVTGGSITILVSAGTLTPIGVLGGCVLGAGTLGFFGGAIGGAATGLPAVAAAWPQAYDQLHSKGLIAAPMPGAPS